MKRLEILRIFSLVAMVAAGYSAESAAQDVYIHNGFVSGNDYRGWSSTAKERYVIGLIEGMLLAPFFGASKEQLSWLEECATGMTSSQIVAILDKYLDENPARWHEDMHALGYVAMKDACNRN